MNCPKCGQSLGPDDPYGLCAACLFSAALDFNEPTLPPADSPKYKLIRILGEGGMGIVHLAEQTHPLLRQVALKVVKLGMDSAQVLARFNYERQSLAIMDHPGIARIFDAGITEDGRPFFSMEYVDGIPVTQFCDSHHFTIQDRLALFLQICDAVQHAHRKGVIHRDIKPSNILVTGLPANPQPKVIDFGIAKAIEQPGGDITQLGQFIGTPEYMSPEQADWVTGAIDTSTDVYSLGILLYELLAGVVPFDPQTLRQAGFTELVRIIREQQPPPMPLKLSAASASLRQTDPASLRKQLSGDLNWIVAKSIEKLPASRYASVADLAADIDRHLSDQPVLACPPSTADRSRKFIRRNKLAVFATVSIFITLIAGLAATAWQARIAGEQRTQALAQQAIAEAKTKEAALEQTHARLAQQAAERQTALALKEKLRADSEAASARAVNDFLQNDLLAQADVSRQSGGPDRDLKVRTALDRAALKIAGKFDKQPEIEASIRQTIAMTYFSLNLLPEARSNMDRSLTLLTKTSGPTAPLTLEAQRKSGTIAISEGKLTQAESTLTQALAEARRTLGNSHLITLGIMHVLASAYERQGKAAAAEQLRLTTLEIRKRVSGPDHPDTLATLDNLVGSYSARGAYALAESLINRSVALRTAKFGPEHPDTLRVTTGQTMVLANLGRSDEAELINRRSLEICRRVLGPDSALTQVFLNSLANNCLVLGRFAEAEGLYAESLELRRKHLGPTNPGTLLVMSNLATSYSMQGKNAAADTLYQQALELRRKHLGPDHPSTLSTTLSLGESYNRQSRFAEAETHFRQLIETERRVHGPEHPATLQALQGMAMALSGQSKHSAAQAVYIELLPAQKRVLGPEHPARINSMTLYATLLQTLDNLTDAEPILVEALEIRRRKLSPKHKDLSNSTLNLAKLYLKMGKSDDAARLALQAFDAAPTATESSLVRDFIETNLKNSLPKL